MKKKIINSFIFLFLVFCMLFLGGFLNISKASTDIYGWDNYIIGSVQYWESGDIVYTLPSSGYWHPNVITSSSLIPQENYSLDDFYIGQSNVTKLLKFMNIYDNVPSNSSGAYALAINKVMYQEQIKLKDLVLYYQTKTTYNQFDNVKIIPNSSWYLWLTAYNSGFSFGVSGDFIPISYIYSYVLNDNVRSFVKDYSSSGDTTLVSYRSTTKSSNNYSYTFTNYAIGCFSDSYNGNTTPLTLMEYYFSGDNFSYFKDASSWNKVDVNPFPTSEDIVPEVTPTPIPTPRPTEVQNVVDAQTDYWGDADSLSGDNFTNSISNFINDGIESFSGDLADNAVASALEDFESGFFNLLSNRDISSMDFRVFWPNISWSWGLDSPMVIIPSGDVNFSKICRDNPTMGNIQDTVRVIFNFFFGYNLLVYAYNLILICLGVGDSYLLDNPDNPVEDIVIDANTGVESSYLSTRGHFGSPYRSLTVIRRKGGRR